MHSKQVQTMHEIEKTHIDTRLVDFAVKYSVLAVTSALSTLLGTLLFLMIRQSGSGDTLNANVDALVNSIAVVMMDKTLDQVYKAICGGVDNCCHAIVVPRIQNQMADCVDFETTTTIAITTTTTNAAAGSADDDKPVATN